MSFLALSANIAYADLLQPDNGGGMVAGNVRDHLTTEQRAAISQELAKNRKMLLERGLLITEEARAEASVVLPLFDWPTTHSTTDPGYFGISGFVDHEEAFPDQLED